jgi:hypothetical protein
MLPPFHYGSTFAFSPDGSSIIAAPVEVTIKIWNVQDGRLRAELPARGISSFLLTTDGAAVVSRRCRRRRKSGPSADSSAARAPLRPISAIVSPNSAKNAWVNRFCGGLWRTSLASSPLMAEGKLRHVRCSVIRAAGRVTRCLAVEPTADVLDRVLIEAAVKAARDVADVWRGQQVRQRAERMVERQRLLVEDVDGSTGDLLGFERGN